MRGRILILHGPNLNLLGEREPEIYGYETLKDINEDLEGLCEDYNYQMHAFQSNSESELIEKIHEAQQIHDGIVFNPGAFTHYSIAIRDAISSVTIPVVEVHLSNVYQREEFRQHSVVSAVCIGKITGFGSHSYSLGIQALIQHLESKS
ncbi:type II 3-dehydroquinate dehydratase [Desulfuribacillus alkaliarsenatis]|uniref:3-dehydroquinate dehydratase n=1 Tax=Desulfuribacillus alkaliarsenatis TaxID=766136 RepID=A0A1E5G5F7_9FIRM|nr:type II 3-dehydroquinate dehydratase [Desulfuribacillus alkaliarsenatis]OEF98422.1 type II 3-dehydroquinate dehydratase [Desulfuribacillus alkaliarsenatis]